MNPPQRNVISTRGHLASFVASVVLLIVDSIVPAVYFVKLDSLAGPPMICYFFIFLFPSINMFVFTFVEIMFTESLRRDLLEFICWKMR